MGTELVGTVELENGERVFVTLLVREMEASMGAKVHSLRSLRILDAEGNVIQKTGMLSFGLEPNPDADDGSFVGSLIDVARPDEA